MKNKLSLLFALLLLFGCGSSNTKSDNSTAPEVAVTPADPVAYANTITQAEIKEMLYKFASDEFEGRDTGAPGQKKSVEYLKQIYMDLGVESPMSGDNYFQEVPLEKRQVAKSTVTLNGETIETFNNQFCLTGSDTQSISANDIVYAGYGIETDSYSDYKELDVKDKIVLIKAGEPKNEDGTFVTSNGTEATEWSGGRQAISSKRDLARDKGARAAILLENELYPRYSGYFSSMANYDGGSRLSMKSQERDMPLLMVNEDFAKKLMPTINEDHNPQTISKPIKIAIESSSESITSENVLAVIKGSEKPDEVIVLSAHLDHLGVRDGKVYPGADDDGSGTIALVEMAEAFKKAVKDGNGPKRTILFLHVTGEEKGLFGSRHYTDNDPIYPLENTVANLNIDMIGRIDTKHEEANRNYIYLIGSDKLSSDLHNISEEINSKYINLELDYTYNAENDPNRFYYRSDHYNFAKNNVPVIFYFNGVHADYHQPGDTPDKIEYDLLEQRTKLVFHTAWELANRDERIVVDKTFE